MKTKLCIFALLIVACSGMNAQSFSAATENSAIQSHQIMQAGSAYDGTVYAPFDNTVPSEQSAVGASYSPAKAPGGPRRSFDKPTNPGNQSNDYPLGDGLLPLMLMAIAFAGATYFLRKRETETK